MVKVGAGDYRMLYTGVDADGIERVGYATSTDGSTWTKQGVVLDPSLTPVLRRRERRRTDRDAGRRRDAARLDERHRPHGPHARRPRDDGLPDW